MYGILLLVRIPGLVFLLASEKVIGPLGGGTCLPACGCRIGFLGSGLALSLYLNPPENSPRNPKISTY